MVHTIEAAQRRLVADPSPEQLEMWRSRPSKEQPLIWRHRDGRRSVVLGPTADHVVGMEPEEGTALLDDILARATAPERVYRHEWREGDLVIWDNRGVLHRALPYDPTGPRDMHRTHPQRRRSHQLTIEETTPWPASTPSLPRVGARDARRAELP